MRGRQILYPKFRRASNRPDGLSVHLLRLPPVTVYRPAHEGRLFIGVGGPKCPDDGIEQFIFNNALDAHFRHLLLQPGAARDIAHHDGDEVGVVPPGAQEDLRDPRELVRGRLVGGLDGAEALEQRAEVVAEDGLEHLVLRREVVVEEPVRDAGLRRDVTDPRAVVAALGENADRGIEDPAPTILLDG